MPNLPCGCEQQAHIRDVGLNIQAVCTCTNPKSGLGLTLRHCELPGGLARTKASPETLQMKWKWGRMVVGELGVGLKTGR